MVYVKDEPRMAYTGLLNDGGVLRPIDRYLAPVPTGDRTE